jgi:hypothetical protein
MFLNLIRIVYNNLSLLPIISQLYRVVRQLALDILKLMTQTNINNLSRDLRLDLLENGLYVPAVVIIGGSLSSLVSFNFLITTQIS